jgi:hypothetical protein
LEDILWIVVLTKVVSGKRKRMLGSKFERELAVAAVCWLEEIRFVFKRPKKVEWMVRKAKERLDTRCLYRLWSRNHLRDLVLVIVEGQGL